MSSQELISIVKLSDQPNIYESLQSGLKLIGSPKFKKDDVVVIKPNLCCIKGPETGATTDLRVMEAIIRHLQEEFNVSDITVVESDGTQILADMAFKLLGYEELAKKLNFKLVNLSKDKFTYKEYPNNVFMKKIKYPETMARANQLIAVPKIKLHTLCFLGGTMKNQFGCNPYPKKTIYHDNLHDSLVDVTTIFKPNLVVVDGIIGMEGRGPVGGIPVKMNTLIFGRDAVAVDHLLARIIGVNPDKVKYLNEAKKRGLGTTDYQIVGANLKDVERPFVCAPTKRKLYGLFSL